MNKLMTIIWTEKGINNLGENIDMQGTNYYDIDSYPTTKWDVIRIHDGKFWTAGNPAFVCTEDGEYYFYLLIKDFVKYHSLGWIEIEKEE